MYFKLAVIAVSPYLLAGLAVLFVLVILKLRKSLVKDINNYVEKVAQAQYLNNPNICPHCKSAYIHGYGGIVSDSETEVHQEIVCQDCGFRWFDIYKLVGYEPK